MMIKEISLPLEDYTKYKNISKGMFAISELYLVSLPKFDSKKSFISMVGVNVNHYLGNQEPVKKTLTIPRWADKLGRELGLNFSQTLTEAIVERKINF